MDDLRTARHPGEQMTPRYRALLALILVLIFGLAAKRYPGPGRWWVNDWGPASVAYVVFFMLLAFVTAPRRSAATPIAIGVCLSTCLIEFLQLWHPSWLQTLRSSFLGRSLLGTTFSWWDFPAYLVGTLLGWLLLRCIAQESVRSE